ncbi:MAG TPA: FIST N-terminal domain-containing protein [Rhizomicrobium sp.]|nr:FIST N-terminal domain-containing protein [Rhizomicrobium sp.]
MLAFGGSGTVAGPHWEDLRRRHPNAIVLGCSTGGEIHGCDVLDETISATAIRFDRTSLIAAEADIVQDSFEAGRKIGGALARPGLKAVFVLSDGTRTNGSDLVRGLRDAVGSDVVLAGGLAGDGPNFGTTYVGLNAVPMPGKVAAIGFCGDKLHVGHGSSGGWDVFGPERRITRAKPMCFTNWTASRRSIFTSAISALRKLPGCPAAPCFFPCASIPPTSRNRRWFAPWWGWMRMRAP